MKKYSLLFVFMVVMMGLVSSCGDDDNTWNGSIKAYTNCPDSNHPHMIDMGLPSGTLWACCNVGTNTPEGYGGYYAWGETDSKSSYQIENYLYKGPAIIDLGNDIAGTPYDVAHKIWGSNWRMASVAQWKELEDNCRQEFTTKNGIKGVKVIAPNGGTIFLPAAGSKTIIDLGVGISLSYWSSTHYKNHEAYGIGSSDGIFHQQGFAGSTPTGKSVRPVVGTGASYMSFIRENPYEDVSWVTNDDDNSGTGSGSGGSGSTGDAPYVTSFDFTATKSSITVKFMCSERPTNATIKYGTSSPTSTASSSISGKQVSATVSGLKSGTKYYFKCTVKNSYGSSTSDTFSAITNY